MGAGSQSLRADIDPIADLGACGHIQSMQLVWGLFLAAFLSHQDEPAHLAPRFTPVESASWAVCRSSHVAAGSRLGAVGAILGRDELFRLADDPDCQVTLKLQPADLSLPAKIKLPSCVLAYRVDGSSVNKIELAPLSRNPVDLQKCLFRVGLWVSGSADAMSAPDESLFIPIARSRWSGMGPTMPDIVPLRRAD